MWRHVTPALTEDHTVVLADLRGYGDPVSVWEQEQHASDVRGSALPTDHFLPEEAPDPVTAALRDFLGRLPFPPIAGRVSHWWPRRCFAGERDENALVHRPVAPHHPAVGGANQPFG